MRLLALLAIATIALSGCGGVPTEQSFTVPEDAPEATDAHDGDGFDLRVQVTDHNGTPIGGAAVVLFTMADTWGGSAYASASAGQDGARAVAFWEAEFTQYNLVAGLRTNAAGWAVADLPPNSSIHVAAGDVAAMTTEVRLNVAVGGGGQSGSVAIPLYPETIHYSFDASFGNHANVAGLGPDQQEAYRIAFSDDAALSKAYTSRIYSVEASTTWTNDLTQGGDLHIGIGDDRDARWIGADKQQIALDGTHTETVSVTSSDLDGERQSLTERGYHAHLITDWVTLSFDDLDATIDVTATLKGSNIRIN